MSGGVDPISAIAGAIGDTFNAVGSVATSALNLKATKVQSAAQRYIAGQITEQEYIKLQAQEENNLSGTVNSILTAQQKTDYLPYILVGGIILIVVIAIAKKSKAT